MKLIQNLLKSNSIFVLAQFSILTISIFYIVPTYTDELITEIKRDCIISYSGDDFCWFHPRLATIPIIDNNGYPRILMTLQKHLMVSDYYSGIYISYTDDGGKTWTTPQLVPELDWVKEEDGVTASVCDVTPGWHQKTKKYLAIGIRVRYDDKGHQVRDRAGRVEGVYAVYDPVNNKWTNWKKLDFKGELENCFSTMPGCTQWIVEDDDSILLPIYFAKTIEDNNKNYSATVIRYTFDGENLKFVENGDILTLNIPRGLCEPSLTKFQGKYYLTLRNDERGYVTCSDDGLHYKPIKPWVFDDGSELGSYNTQQHWATHSDGLFLIYTRKGANNDHIIRHRAPLLIAQVNPDYDNICVIRNTEKIVFPERGATMGNFGVYPVSPNETWVTVGEGMFNNARARGAQGCVLLGRIVWSTPNKQVTHIFKPFPNKN